MPTIPWRVIVSLLIKRCSWFIRVTSTKTLIVGCLIRWQDYQKLPDSFQWDLITGGTVVVYLLRLCSCHHTCCVCVFSGHSPWRSWRAWFGANPRLLPTPLTLFGWKEAYLILSIHPLKSPCGVILWHNSHVNVAALATPHPLSLRMFCLNHNHSQCVDIASRQILFTASLKYITWSSFQVKTAKMSTSCNKIWESIKRLT